MHDFLVDIGGYFSSGASSNIELPLKLIQHTWNPEIDSAYQYYKNHLISCWVMAIAYRGHLGNIICKLAQMGPFVTRNISTL